MFQFQRFLLTPEQPGMAGNPPALTPNFNVIRINMERDLSAAVLTGHGTCPNEKVQGEAKRVKLNLPEKFLD